MTDVHDDDVMPGEYPYPSDDYGPDECPDCVCCARDDCTGRACVGGSCPCTEA